MTNYPAIAMFFIFVFATLMITYWAAKKTKSRSVECENQIKKLY